MIYEEDLAPFVSEDEGDGEEEATEETPAEEETTEVSDEE